jgi:hypothetical protein
MFTNILGDAMLSVDEFVHEGERILLVNVGKN